MSEEEQLEKKEDIIETEEVKPVVIEKKNDDTPVPVENSDSSESEPVIKDKKDDEGKDIPIVEDPKISDKNAPEVKPVVEEKPDESAKQTMEQLSIIKEVRNELAKSYHDMKELKKTNEMLSESSEDIKITLSKKDKDIESLSVELNAYKAREEAVVKAQHVKRLEQLSVNFAELGQVKSIEHLSKLDTAVIAEFEEITNIALSRKTAEQLDAVTVPTQGMAQKKVVVAAPPKKITNTDFFSGLCNTLGSQQKTDGGDSKRTINL